MRRETHLKSINLQLCHFVFSSNWDGFVCLSFFRKLIIYNKNQCACKTMKEF